MHSDDPTDPLTPLPGDRDHRRSHDPLSPRAVPPSGKVSPDGRRIWPRPSLSSRILVVGGMGIMAAATTAAAIMATRKVAGLIAGGQEDPVARPGLAPVYADLDEEEREEIRRRDRDRARRDANHLARTRAQAARERFAQTTRRGGGGSQRGVAEGLTATADRLSGSLHGVVGALTGALSGFRSVASQAGTIAREFSEAADTVRTFLGDDHGRARRAAEDEQRADTNEGHDRPPGDRRIHTL